MIGVPAGTPPAYVRLMCVLKLGRDRQAEADLELSIRRAVNPRRGGTRIQFFLNFGKNA